MRSDNTCCESIKEALNGRPGQPIVFGVCKALAARFGCEVWVCRGVTIVLGLFWSLPVLAAYIILGLVLKETEVRTRGFFAGLAVVIRESFEKLLRAFRDTPRSNGYNGSYR